MDCFALLNEPRLPWLDDEELKARFLARSAAVHPDRVHGACEAEKAAANQQYAELNAAYQRLREPKDRLLHILELEAGSKPRDVQRIPPGTMDLFVEVGQLCRDVDAFLAGKSGTTSPMVKVRMFEQGLEWTDKLQALLRSVQSRSEALLVELREMNPIFVTAPPVGSGARAGALPLERLEQIYRALSYVSRWTGQLQERLVQLSF